MIKPVSPSITNNINLIKMYIPKISNNSINITPKAINRRSSFNTTSSK